MKGSGGKKKNKSKNDNNKEQQRKSKYAHKALDYAEALLDENSNNQAAKILQGRILGLLGEHDLGLTLLRESLAKLQSSNNTSQQQDKVDQLLQQVKQYMIQGQVEEAEALLEEIQNLRNQKFALFVQPSDLIDLQLSIAELEQDSNDWSSCQQTLRALVTGTSTSAATATNTAATTTTTTTTDGGGGSNNEGVTMTPDQQLKVFTAFSKCCFHQKQYDKAIEFGNMAIDMNRHYPQVHKHVILSHYEKGDVQQAQSVANRAILYETPWDEQNKRRNQAMYFQLFA